MAPRPKTQPRKKPAQRRAQETVRALIEASARILATEGVDALNTNRVAEVAGVAVGSLYQYFPSKEALVGAVIEARIEQDAALVDALLRDEGTPLRERTLGIVGFLCDRQLEGAKLMPALLALLGEVERDALARQMFSAMTERLRDALLREPELLRPELREPEALDVALFVVGRSLRWVSNEAVVSRPELLRDPRFRAELRRVVEGLFVPA